VSSQLDRIVTVCGRLPTDAVSRFAHGMSS
jgi:hypothetical protein